MRCFAMWMMNSHVKARVKSSYKWWTMRHRCFCDVRKNRISYTLYSHCYKWRLAMVGLIKVLMNYYIFLGICFQKIMCCAKACTKLRIFLSIRIESGENTCMLKWQHTILQGQCHVRGMLCLRVTTIQAKRHKYWWRPHGGEWTR
jgi:hypothetical protein